MLEKVTGASGQIIEGHGRVNPQVVIHGPQDAMGRIRGIDGLFAPELLDLERMAIETAEVARGPSAAANGNIPS